MVKIKQPNRKPEEEAEINEAASVARPSESVKYRMDMVQINCIKRIPGVTSDTSPESIQKVKAFASRRGYCRPVYLSDAPGFLTLLSGTPTVESCLQEKKTAVPAVILEMQDEADALMFALQSANLDDRTNMIGVGGALVRLIDSYGMSRRQIAENLGKSASWICRVEHLSRELNRSVQEMVMAGKVPARTAQEISRLPGDVQLQFARSVSSEYLNKSSVTYLVNRYLNADTGEEERSRIINNPVQALPHDTYKRARTGKDNSDSARLFRAVARCMDEIGYLLRVLKGIEMDDVTGCTRDLATLAGDLDVLQRWIMEFCFAPGQNEDGGGI